MLRSPPMLAAPTLIALLAATSNPWRQRLLAEIRTRPGVSFKDLVAAVGIGAANARYHLDILGRAEIIRELRILHRLCYAPAGSDLNRVKLDAYLRFDPKLLAVRSQLARGACRATELVLSLRAELGMSRSAGWKLVDRAVQSGLAVKRYEHRRLVIATSPLGAQATDANRPGTR